MSDNVGFEPLHDLVLLRVEREDKLSEHIIAAVGSETTALVVIAAPLTYFNGMGVEVPMRVKAGDRVAPKPSASGAMMPFKLDERKRRAMFEQRKAAGMSDEEAGTLPLLEGEMVLLPYSQLSGRITGSLVPRILKPAPREKTGYGEFQ